MEAPENAMSALRLMPSKKSEVANFAHQIIKSVQGGEANPLEVAVLLKSLEAVCELVRDEIEPNIIAEAEKYGEKVIERYGAKIERAEVGSKYNYSASGDTIYERLQTDLNTAKSRLDERIAILKALKQPMTVVDEMTGEVVTINPPPKTSKSGIKITLK